MTWLLNEGNCWMNGALYWLLKQHFIVRLLVGIPYWFLSCIFSFAMICLLECWHLEEILSSNQRAWESVFKNTRHYGKV